MIDRPKAKMITIYSSIVGAIVTTGALLSVPYGFATDKLDELKETAERSVENQEAIKDLRKTMKEGNESILSAIEELNKDAKRRDLQRTIEELENKERGEGLTGFESRTLERKREELDQL